MALPPEAPAVTYWSSYVSVPDVDAAAAKATALGGQLCLGPTNIPGAGHAALVADPEGAMINLFRDVKGDPETNGAMPGPLTFCWETLNARDIAAASAFYAEVVGWTTGAFNGIATLVSAGGPVADVQQTPEGAPPNWMTFVSVPSLSDRREAAVRLGATVLMPEIPVPGVGVIAVIQDPTGGVIGLFEPSQSCVTDDVKARTRVGSPA
jgi:predicted enzyme related to lactoylglutathione lyase